MGVKKFSYIYVVSLILVSIFGFGFDSGSPEMTFFMKGEGAEENPYIITNLEELRNVSKDLNADYILANDIDANSTRDWNDGKGFIPIGNFTGSFDGQGYTIKDLYINRSRSNHVGLFGFITYKAILRDVRLKDVYVVGNTSVGGLLGRNNGGIIRDCYADGHVEGNNFVGGLVGTNVGTIENSSTDGTVEGFIKEAGGLVGANNGTVLDSYSVAAVNGIKSVGGLSGWNKKVIKDSYSTGDVEGDNHVGGLVGHNYLSTSYVLNSYSNGTVIGQDGVSALVGWNDRGNIENCQAYGQVDGYKNVSGLVGWNRGIVIGSKAFGNVSGDINVGGLVGWNNNTVESSLSTGTVNGDENVGGFVGTNNGTVLRSYSTGTVTGNGTTGGFVGWNYLASINNSYTKGDVNADVDVGGFVGWNSKSKDGIRNSYSTGTVNGDENDGGFCGTNLGDVFNSFWDYQNCGLTYSDGGIGMRTSYMKDVYTFTNTSTLGLYEPWDFVGDPYEDESDENIWNIDEDGMINEGYPFLAWDVKTIMIYPSEDQTITAGEMLNFTAEAYHGESVLITNVTSMFTWENTTENGTFVITDSGTYNVTTSYQGVSSSVVEVVVEPANVSKVEIILSEDQIISAGEMIYFKAWANDTYGNVVTDNSTEFIWQNTTDDGIFDITTVGIYGIRASYGGYSSKTVSITVETSDVSTVEITPDSDQTITAGETIDFDAEAYDKYGNLITDIDSNFTWQNTDDKGVFSITTEGEYEVNAGYGGVTSSSVSVTVGVSDVSTVEITPVEDQTIAAGETVNFDAVAYDEYGNTITSDDADFSWENTDVDGIFDITSVGMYNITATYESVSSIVVTVTVEEASVSTVEISPVEEQSITAGETIDFDAEAFDEYGNLITEDDGEFSWNNTDTEGMFSITEAGSYVVNANYEGIGSKSVTVTVSASEVYDIEITPSDQQTLTAGETIDFSAEAYDEYGNLITDKDSDFGWQNTDSSGVFSLTIVGEYMVTAEHSGMTSDQVSVTVGYSSVDIVEMICLGEQTIQAGDTVNFTAWANDSYGNTITNDDADFDWENANEGEFGMTVVGDYDVTATYEGVTSDPIMIDVKVSEVSTVEITPSDGTSISAGMTLEFKAWANDSYGNTVTSDSADFTWDNSGDDGVFEESTPGDYVVSASYKDVDSDLVTVTVKGTVFKCSNLRIDPKKAMVGEEITLMIDVTNEGNVAGEYTVEFHIDGEKIGSDTVEVDAGDTETVSMGYEVEEKGSHTLEVATESMTVNAEENIDDGGGNDSDDDGGWSLLTWGMIVLIAALLVILVILVRNRFMYSEEESETEEDQDMTEETEDFFEEDEGI